MKGCGEMDTWLHAFLIFTLYGGEGSALHCSLLKLQGGNSVVPFLMRCTVVQIYFDKVLYMFQTDILSMIRSLNTVYAAIGICRASYVDCLLARSGCSIQTLLADSQHN